MSEESLRDQLDMERLATQAAVDARRQAESVERVAHAAFRAAAAMLAASERAIAVALDMCEKAQDNDAWYDDEGRMITPAAVASALRKWRQQ